MTVRRRTVMRVAEGDVMEYTISSASGAAARLLSLGATLASLRVPDRTGRPGEVTLGYASAEALLEAGNPTYFGVTVGRFANRIRGGRFTLDGREYRLARNEGGANHLHGGSRGFDKRLWSGEPFEEVGRAGVRWSYRSPDGEEGYPGNLDVVAEYSLAEDGTLRMGYEARSDAPTVLNLTNHAYWNLSGRGTILDEALQIHASRYLEVDAGLLPTGRAVDVAGTAFDFRSPRRIGERIEATGSGYDHCYLLDASPDPEGLSLAAILRDPASGRSMTVRTSQPGVQLYSGNFLARNGFLLHGALCLETQHFPDCVNHPEFPSASLRPGQVYRHTTVHSFGTT
jgi:aldose 1-epimerase